MKEKIFVNEAPNNSKDISKPKVSWIRVLLSVLSSFVGIQTNKNRKYDFSEYASPWPFIVVGLALFLLFISAIIWVARFVAYS